MRQMIHAKPKPFLDPARRQWQFETYAWLLRGCGGYQKFLDTDLVLPIPEHFPDRGMKGHAAATALFRRVRDHAGMADWPCIAEPSSASSDNTEPSSASSDNTEPSSASTDNATLESTSNRIRIIRYSAAEQDPAVLVAHFAHELARFLVESFEETPPGGPMLREPAIDLATVFMGFGVFMANSAVRNAPWDLNEGELVHALALFCHLRKVSEDDVDPHLNAHVRKYLRLAARDLGRFECDFRKLRGVFPIAPADAGECTLPTRRG